MPGTYPRIVNTKQMKNSTCGKIEWAIVPKSNQSSSIRNREKWNHVTVQQPWRRQTPRGGSKIASRISQNIIQQDIFVSVSQSSYNRLADSGLSNVGDDRVWYLFQIWGNRFQHKNGQLRYDCINNFIVKYASSRNLVSLVEIWPTNFDQLIILIKNFIR